MSDSYNPQRMARILHQAMEEILGGEALHSMLDVARTASDATGAAGDRPAEGTDDSGLGFKEGNGRFSPSDLGQILITLEKTYGPQAGRGLALRIGRASFEVWAAGIWRHTRRYFHGLPAAAAARQDQYLCPGSYRFVQQHHRADCACRGGARKSAVVHGALPVLPGEARGAGDLPVRGRPGRRSALLVERW